METLPVDERSDSGPITVFLSQDEALVLDAFLSRGAGGDDYRSIEDQAELRVLWDLQAILESWLAAPMQADYVDRLRNAREAVRDQT